MWNHDTRPAARPDLVLRKAADQWLLFDATGTELHVMNLTATLVWSLCTGEHSVQQIAESLAAAYPSQPRESLRDEVRRVLEQFTRSGLLQE